MFSLHFSGFQNDSFCTRKRPILLDRMNHSERQNGPFCNVKWAILKNGKKNLPVLSDSFIKTSASVFVEWKKKNTRFFGMKCLQSRSAFRLFRQYGFDEALGPCHTCDFLIPECHWPTFHKPFKKHSICSLLLVAEVVSVQVVVVQTVSLQTGMARRNRLVGEYKVKPYYLITGVNKMLSIWIYFLYCNP